VTKENKPINYKVGQKLYTVCSDEETGKSVLDTYIVRTIRRGRVYATLFEKGLTWVKRSSKHGDFGWAQNIPSWCRKVTVEGTAFRNLFTTKRQAWVAQEKSFLKLKIDYEEDAEFQVACDKILRTCKMMIAKESPSRKAKKK
jgi:hypothetical protein